MYNIIRIAKRISRIAFQDCIATDKDLSIKIRDALVPVIYDSMGTGVFTGEFWDIGERRTQLGYRPGFVSFNLLPTMWEGMPGGLHIEGKYEPKKVKSNAPETGTPEYEEWVEQGGNQDLMGGEAESMTLKASYYSKSSGGGIYRPKSLTKEEAEDLYEVNVHQIKEVDLGGATFLVSQLEEIESITIDDPGLLKKNLHTLIQEVAKALQSSKSISQKRRSGGPYGSLRKFLTYLNEENRDEFTWDEVYAVYDQSVARDAPIPTNRIIDYLNKAYKHGPTGGMPQRGGGLNAAE